MKRSRRLIGTRSRKSLLKRISKKRMFMKRGGGIEDDILRKVETLRERDGDFVDEQPLKELTGAELVAKMRALRNASDGSVSLGDAAKFGKDLISSRRISAYNDEVIKELFAAYDMNSIKELILSSDPVQLNLQEFLPRHMIQSFGGDLSNWAIQKISSNEFPPSSKPKLTPRDLPRIQYAIQNILKKYPEIDMSNENTQQLIIKDLLKKMYYLKEISKSESPTMNGGSRFLQFGSGEIINILILTGIVYYLLPLYLEIRKMEKKRINDPEGYAQDLKRHEYYAKMKRAKPLSEYPYSFDLWWRNNLSRPYTGWFGYDKDELNDYIDLQVDKYLSSETKLQNEMDEDIQKMQKGIKPTSENYLKSEELWNPKGWYTKYLKEKYHINPYYDDTKTTNLPETLTALHNPTYRDAFIDSKVDEYLALEPQLRANKHDKKISRAVFNEFQGMGM